MNPNIVPVIKDLLNWKTGWKTSEFWVALVPALTAALSVFGVHLGNSQTTHLLIIVWGAVAIVYATVRTWLKAVHVGHAASLATILHSVEQEVVKDLNFIGNRPLAGPAGQQSDKP